MFFFSVRSILKFKKKDQIVAKNKAFLACLASVHVSFNLNAKYSQCRKLFLDPFKPRKLMNNTKKQLIEEL